MALCPIKNLTSEVAVGVTNIKAESGTDESSSNTGLDGCVNFHIIASGKA